MLGGVRRGATDREPAHERQQHDGAIRVSVSDGGQLRADLDLADQFFGALAHERIGGRFAGLDFATGKFPLTAEVLVRGTPREQHTSLVLDQSADDADWLNVCGFHQIA